MIKHSRVFHRDNKNSQQWRYVGYSIMHFIYPARFASNKSYSSEYRAIFQQIRTMEANRNNDVEP